MSSIMRPMLAMLSVMFGITSASTFAPEPEWGRSCDDRVFRSTLPLAVARTIDGPPDVQAARSVLE
eukprot:10925212-Heterocapsa_arctica.AAC.1